MATFDTSKKDSQATIVKPVSTADFDLNAYADYASELEERCSSFMKHSSGVLVYRRMRVSEVFSSGCRDMKQSLEWQLGALKESMKYKADIPNFLEPWYGIGTIASAFGMEYIWHPGLAPATQPKFETIDEALMFEPVPAKDTEIGRHTLQMIEFFMDQTKGRLPISFSDVQSPFNNATSIVNTSNFLVSMILEPEKVLAFLDRLADLMIDYYKEQEKLIGNALVKPGHGFACSRAFEGFGMSDDNIVMIDSDSYLNFMAPSVEKTGKAFGGPVLHSCGNFSDKTGLFSKVNGLKMVDGAFTIETDPSPNPSVPFREALSGSGVILNARMVGDKDTVQQTIRDLWDSGMKLIAVTYAQTPEEQEEIYRMIQELR